MTTKERYYNNILTLAQTNTKKTTWKPWAQYSTAKARALALLSIRLACYKNINNKQAIEDTKWVINKFDKE